ncbi:MAG TPA: D-glycero-beta-D-manno-heptose 1-phosphate adenylyltransferase [Bacteroidales bacterium]|jgi:rfaE bifunctional protein nucleotidyltransferase chain/domain|nr:D-glycero-beta-D-manno-heptose 1-phosphate adenylyltransferase [Bacteroidales bacterium]
MDHYTTIQNKIITEENLQKTLENWRIEGKKIVFTNGCFDILHRGHVEYLAKAASYGDALIIGLNSDTSVRNIKGPERPVQDEKSRSIVLASLQFVTAVILFSEDTPYELIKKVQPDFLVKGADYKPEDIVGYDILKAKGGEVKTIELVEGHSTTNIIKKLK